MKIKTCISTLRKLQFNRIKDVDELIEITGMVYEDLIYGVFNGCLLYTSDAADE